MELTGKRIRGRPNRRFMDVVRVDMRDGDVTKKAAETTRRWKR